MRLLKMGWLMGRPEKYQMLVRLCNLDTSLAGEPANHIPISSFYFTHLLHFQGFCLTLTKMALAAKAIPAKRNAAVVSLNSVAVGIIRIGIRPHGPA